MDRQTRIDRLCGCYITVPTMFSDEDLENTLGILLMGTDYQGCPINNIQSYINILSY